MAEAKTDLTEALEWVQEDWSEERLRRGRVALERAAGQRSLASQSLSTARITSWPIGWHGIRSGDPQVHHLKSAGGARS